MSLLLAFQAAPPAETFVPFTRANLAVMAAWIDPPPLPSVDVQAAPGIPGWSVDWPPVRLFMPPGVWTPPDPQPQRFKPTSAPPGWSVDNPPVVGGKIPLAVPLWTPPDPQPQVKQPTAAPPGWSVDPPPPWTASRIAAFLETWEPSVHRLRMVAPLLGGAAFPTQFSGFEVYYGGAVRELCLVAEADAPAGMGGVVKFRKGGVTYALYLVETTDPNASPVRMQTMTGIKAIRKKT